MDVQELVAWSVLACLFLGLLVARVPAARRGCAALVERLVDEVTAVPEVDQDALDLYQALRRQRLLEHVARLRRILADDSHQSAVRQLGNRLAYAQLLTELAELGESVRTAPARPGTRPDWTPVAAVAGRGGAGASAGVPYAPRVEVLDFGRPPRR